MQSSSIETVDIIIFIAVVLAVTLWSFHTLDRDMARAQKLTERGQRIPWRIRHFPGKTKKDLQADLVGRSLSFFLMLIGFSYLKTQDLALSHRMIASAAICLALFSTIPRLFVVLNRKFLNRQFQSEHDNNEH